MTFGHIDSHPDTDSVEPTAAGSVGPEALGETEQATADNVVMVQGRPLRELPNDLFIPPEALEVFLDSFQGPLDLLLYLIRRHDLDILDIPIAVITRQYMEYVDLMRQFRLDLAAEYLLMAATLAEIKSWLLLPKPANPPDLEEEDPRMALVKRLQEYERFSQVAKKMGEHPRLERELYLVTAEFEDMTPCRIQPRASLSDLVLAFRMVLERSEHHRHYEVGQEMLTVRERMTDILDRLQRVTFLRFEDLFDPDEGRLGMVVSFIAILEMCRDQVLVISQREPFASIHIRGVEPGLGVATDAGHSDQ